MYRAILGDIIGSLFEFKHRTSIAYSESAVHEIAEGGMLGIEDDEITFYQTA